MGSRLILILDDLLWVLTDSQLKAALHFIDSLGGLIEKATVLERKTKAARKLEVCKCKIRKQNRKFQSYKYIFMVLGIARVSSTNISTIKDKKSI